MSSKVRILGGLGRPGAIAAILLAILALMVTVWLWNRADAEERDRSAHGASTARQAAPLSGENQAVLLLRPRVLRRLPHDAGAWTQGLLLHDNVFFESTGLVGRSSLRRVKPDSGEVLLSKALPQEIFGEGLERVGSRLIQLSWKAGRAFVWDLKRFSLLKEHRYRGEGWGLCYNGKDLVMSDGSEMLTLRDPTTFAAKRRIRVLQEGEPVRRLNELECVEGEVYANVWQTDDIVRVAMPSGRVTARIHASGLLRPDERSQSDVLNGIAWNPKRGTFFLTGKFWPAVFEVRFVEE